jgi:hypothetical protein
VPQWGSVGIWLGRPWALAGLCRRPDLPPGARAVQLAPEAGQGAQAPREPDPATRGGMHGGCVLRKIKKWRHKTGLEVLLDDLRVIIVRALVDLR